MRFHFEEGENAAQSLQSHLRLGVTNERGENVIYNPYEIGQVASETYSKNSESYVILILKINSG
jgi:hypothetical protein